MINAFSIARLPAAAFVYLLAQDYTWIVVGFALQGMFACGGLWSGVPAYLSERFPEDGMAATAGKLRTLRLFRHWQHPHRRCSSGYTVSQPGNRLRPATDRDCLKHELRIAGVRDKLRLLLRSGGGS